jgi:hypothetical protein
MVVGFVIKSSVRRMLKLFMRGNIRVKSHMCVIIVENYSTDRVA